MQVPVLSQNIIQSPRNQTQINFSNRQFVIQKENSKGLQAAFPQNQAQPIYHISSFPKQN